MVNKYINFYNNLVTLTRNKGLYEEFTTQDTFSQRLIIFLFHFAFFLQIHKNPSNSKLLQNVYDSIFKQMEYSLREQGLGDITVNKKMKNYINIFHSILNKIENWHEFDYLKKKTLLIEFLNLNNQLNTKIIDNFDKYRDYLSKNSLNSLLKGVSKPNF